jgi:hypothetical protein
LASQTDNHISARTAADPLGLAVFIIWSAFNYRQAPEFASDEIRCISHDGEIYHTLRERATYCGARFRNAPNASRIEAMPADW